MKNIILTKKGQVSVEILYAIGVMLVIFLILNGVAFNRRQELQRNSDYFLKRDACMKISDVLVGAYTSGDGSQIEFSVLQNTTVFSVGLVLISDDVRTQNTIEATCTFNGNTSKTSYNIKGTLYKVVNSKNVLDIFKWDSGSGTWVSA